MATKINLNDILGTDPDAVVDHISLRMETRHMLEAMNTALDEREKSILIHRLATEASRHTSQNPERGGLSPGNKPVIRFQNRKEALQKLRERLSSKGY